jgi:hypothetical protein
MGITPKNSVFWVFWSIVHKKTSLFNKKPKKTSKMKEKMGVDSLINGG